MGNEYTHYNKVDGTSGIGMCCKDSGETPNIFNAINSSFLHLFDTHIPCWLPILKNIKYLYIQTHKHIFNLNETHDFSHLIDLEYLSIDGVHINKINLSNNTKLKKIVFTNNKLKSWKNIILPFVDTIFLSSNDIDDLTNAPDCNILVLTNNPLTFVTEEVLYETLKKINCIYLDNTIISDRIERRKNLKGENFFYLNRIFTVYTQFDQNNAINKTMQ
jgi:hypothetical protein